MFNDISKRILELDITKLDEKGNIEFQRKFENSLNVKFNYQKYIGSILYGKGKVSICGLDNKTIQVLTGFLDITTELNKRRIIKVKAGYESENNSQENQLGLMIDGTIIGALPTLPPDIWLNCEVINNFEQYNKTINFATTESLKFKDYVQTVADTIGIKKIENRIKKQSFLDRVISKQSIPAGNIFDIVYSISNVFNFDDDYNTGVVSYVENETLIVDYTDLPYDDERTQNPILINKSNGMIGLPELTNAGIIANITTLLNTTIKTGDVIKLESSQIPSANGLYYVIGITHNGEYRGNSWYSMFHCRRILN